MTEKSSVEIFNENYPIIKEKIVQAAKSAGKSEKDIILLAATKTVDIDTVNFAIKSGIEYIGENKVQEFLSKYENYEKCHKHFIGHLQTNKVKDLIGKVELIHSVDSLHLAKEISKQSKAKGIVSEILLEVNIGKEQTKSGFSVNETQKAVEEISSYGNIYIRGLMAIPPIADEKQKNRKFFYEMNKLFVDIRDKKIDNSSMDILSMGMSDDFTQAISEGANMVRIGTALFGRRNYNI